jgi:hypothetical protein
LGTNEKNFIAKMNKEHNHKGQWMENRAHNQRAQTDKKTITEKTNPSKVADRTT